MTDFFKIDMAFSKEKMCFLFSECFGERDLFDFTLHEDIHLFSLLDWHISTL